jgi:hypothetical protein
LATENFLHFTPCGLVLDVSGVLLLGFAFFLKTTESMIAESGTTWDSKAYITVAASKCDGIFGSVLLVFGFLYQMLGYVGVESTNAVLVSYLAQIVFLVAYVTFLRGWLIHKWVGDIEAKLRERQP